MKTILCSGQSNTLDHAIGGDLDVGLRVTVWNCESERNDTANLGSAFLAYDPAQPPFINAGVAIFPKMAHYLAEALDEDVRIVSVAKSGTSLDGWVAGNCLPGPMLTRMLAVLSAAGVTSVDAFCWMQGETPTSDYVKKFENLVILLKQSGIIGTGKPVVLGELAPQFSDANASLTLLSYLHSDIRLARIGHLPTFDEIHYTGPSKNRAGLAFAKQLLEIWE